MVYWYFLGGGLLSFDLLVTATHFCEMVAPPYL
uniref:Uncharacterized protein n=1 Tax=Arundo donax TaxID=35708 RepID=A0A0A9MZD1_ARUDO